MKQSRREFIAGMALLLAAKSVGGAKELTMAPDDSAPLRHVVALSRTLTIEPGRWTTIVGHHSATAVGNAAIFDRYHRSRGMEHGLAYHFVIGNGTHSGDGEIEIGGRWLHQLDGGHVHDDHVNHVGIGICCVGNFEETEPTPAQLASFVALVAYLGRTTVRKPMRFAVHREINPGRTVCPGRSFPVAAMHARFDPAARPSFPS